MADMQTYSHSDIQRYLQHKMTRQEMHDFEKALMNDPFLADALEGFSASDNVLAEKHLSEIESELMGEKEKAKVVAMSLHKKTWWKVASVVLVVVSCGVLTYSLFSKKGAEKNFVQKMFTGKATEMTGKTDSIGPVEKPMAQVEVLPKKELLKKNKKGSPIIREENKEPLVVVLSKQTKAGSSGIAMTSKGEESAALTGKSAGVISNFNPSVSRTAEKVGATKQMSFTSPQPENEFKGKVIDENGQSVPGAGILIKNGDTGTYTDSNGNFTLKAADTVLQLIATAVNYASAETKIKRNSPVNIVLDRSSNTLSEVVVTSLGPKKKRHHFLQLREKTSKEAEPEGGWLNFHRYLLKQVDSLKATDTINYYNKNVKLKFSINKDGRPANIRALKKPDKIMAEKAIQILTNGPKWKNKKKDKKVRIIIPFK